MSEPEGLAYYIYALVEAGSAAPVVEGVLQNTQVDSVPVGAFNVLTSLVPRALFDRAHEARKTSDLAWMAERAAAHHRVTCMAVTEGPCLPLAFGTLFSSQSLLAAWVHSKTEKLISALKQIQGKVEWCVSIEENEGQLNTWLELNDLELHRLVGNAADAGVGTVFLLSKLIDKARSMARTKHFKLIETKINDRLGLTEWPVIVERRRDGVPSWSFVAAQSSGSQELILSTISALGFDLGLSGISLRVTGPWPGYAFAQSVLREEAQNV